MARWRQDGRELYFVTTNAGSFELQAVAVQETGQSLRLGRPERLFAVLFPPSITHVGINYAVADNGQRFLVAGPVAAAASGARQLPLTVVLNWDAALK